MEESLSLLQCTQFRSFGFVVTFKLHPSLSGSSASITERKKQIFLYVVVPLSHHHLLQRLSFSTELPLLFVKADRTVSVMGSFWALCSVAWIHLSVASPNHGFLITLASQQVSLRVRWYQFSDLALLLQFCIDYLGPFAFLHKLFQRFLDSHKITCWILIGIASNLQIKLARTNILTMWRLPICYMEYSSIYLGLL